MKRRDVEIANLVRLAREARGLTLAVVAAKLGLSTPQYRQLERGRGAFSAERLDLLADYLMVRRDRFRSAEDREVPLD